MPKPVADLPLAVPTRQRLLALSPSKVTVADLEGLAIPSRDNGLDNEGLTAGGERVLVGLSGPALPLLAHRCHFLSLSALAVRDLAVVPGRDDPTAARMAGVGARPCLDGFLRPD